MSKKTIEALFLGDICGKPGSRALFIGLKQIIKDHNLDVVIANGENAADGFGIMPEDADTCFAAGVDVITSGNHIWQKEEIRSRLDSDSRILRPANYPPGVPGHGVTVIDVHGIPIAVVNLQGRHSMPVTDCPFRAAKDLVKQLKPKTKIILIDFHAESAEEKEALALYLDGQVTALVGTHTHVQTADEKILPKGTGYITDLGMTGAGMSVIGSDPAVSIARQITQMPLKSEIADVPAMVNGLIVTIDTETGKALELKRLRVFYAI
jgi:2',3'-cyclic-nucleotide 2'-phosphodiesterase